MDDHTLRFVVPFLFLSTSVALCLPVYFFSLYWTLHDGKDAQLRPPMQANSSSPAVSALPQVKPLDITNRRILNVIFDVNPNIVNEGGVMFEGEWILLTLLASLSRPVRVFTESPTLMLNDSLIIVFVSNPGCQRFREMRKLGFRNFGAYVMADEQYSVDKSDFWPADYMMRNYYSLDLVKDAPIPALFAPLGCRPGFHHTRPEAFIPASKRRGLCNFFGTMRSNRQEMVEKLEASRVKCELSTGQGWPFMSPTIEYRAMLLDSVFTLTPWGNNFESQRFYEAVQCGSIPIFQEVPDPSKSFVVALGGGEVVPSVKDWADAPGLIRRLAADPVLLDKVQRNVSSWWFRTKALVQQEFASVIEQSFSKTYGDDN